MDKLKNMGKWKAAVLILALLAVAVGITLFPHKKEDNPAETQEYVGVDKSEEIPGDEEDLIIIHSDLIQNLDYVLMREDIYCVDIGDEWIYITQEGEALTPDSYTVAYPFHEGLACVCKEGKYGFIDTEGRTVIDFLYDRATPFVEGAAYFCKDGSYGFMDRTGTPLFYLDCDSVSHFQEGLARISVDGSYGYIDREGEIIIPPVYDYGSNFQDGYAQIRKDNKEGIIDRTGRALVACEYVEIERRGDCFIGEKNGKYYIFDSQGNALLEEPCDEVSGYDEIFLRYADTGKQGFIHEGKVVFLDPAYSLGVILHDRELVIAGQDGYQGVISFRGEVKIPFCYNSLTYDEEAGVFIVSNEERDKLIAADDFSQPAVCSYRSIGPFVNGRAAVSMEGKYGIIDTQGNLILPLEYDEIHLLGNGAYWFKKDEASYLFDAAGTLLNVGNYDSIMLRGSCYVTQKNYTHVGILNAAGEVILEPVCYNASHRYGYYEHKAGIMVLSGDYQDGILLVRTQREEVEEEEWTNPFRFNEITPRIPQFWNLVKDGSVFTEDIYDWGIFDSEWNCARNSCVIYDYWHTGRPALFVSCDPYVQGGPGHLGYSALFSWKGEEAVCLLDGYECGGTSGGDQVCFWYDTEEDRLLPGTSGYAGGFGGEASYGSVYDYEDGEITKRVSFEWISQSVSEYDEEEYLENAELYYDADGRPFTRETILNSGCVEGYYVNGELTTIEHYQEVRDRYRLQ